jgi:putative ABC transport system ATP-binding protein
MLDVQHVSKTYSTVGGPLTVVKDISFSLTAGTTCAIIGPSGSGKPPYSVSAPAWIVRRLAP